MVATPQAGELAELLAGRGWRVEPGGPGELRVYGADAEQVGEAAAGVGVRLHGLSTVRPSLEEAFMELTDGSVEYHATLPATSSGPSSGPSSDPSSDPSSTPGTPDRDFDLHTEPDTEADARPRPRPHCGPDPVPIPDTDTDTDQHRVPGGRRAGRARRFRRPS